MYKLLSIHSTPQEYNLNTDITVMDIISCFPPLISPANCKSTELLPLVFSTISEEFSQLALCELAPTQKIKLVGSAVPFILDLLISKGSNLIKPEQLAAFESDYDFQVNFNGVSEPNILTFIDRLNKLLIEKAEESILSRENGIHCSFLFKLCGPQRYLLALKFSNQFGKSPNGFVQADIILNFGDELSSVLRMWDRSVSDSGLEINIHADKDIAQKLCIFSRDKKNPDYFEQPEDGSLFFKSVGLLKKEFQFQPTFFDRALLGLCYVFAQINSNPQFFTTLKESFLQLKPKQKKHFQDAVRFSYVLNLYPNLRERLCVDLDISAQFEIDSQTVWYKNQLEKFSNRLPEEPGLVTSEELTIQCLKDATQETFSVELLTRFKKERTRNYSASTASSLEDEPLTPITVSVSPTADASPYRSALLAEPPLDRQDAAPQIFTFNPYKLAPKTNRDKHEVKSEFPTQPAPQPQSSLIAGEPSDDDKKRMGQSRAVIKRRVAKNNARIKTIQNEEALAMQVALKKEQEIDTLSDAVVDAFLKHEFENIFNELFNKQLKKALEPKAEKPRSTSAAELKITPKVEDCAKPSLRSRETRPPKPVVNPETSAEKRKRLAAEKLEKEQHAIEEKKAQELQLKKEKAHLLFQKKLLLASVVFFSMAYLALLSRRKEALLFPAIIVIMVFREWLKVR